MGMPSVHTAPSQPREVDSPETRLRQAGPPTRVGTTAGRAAGAPTGLSVADPGSHTLISCWEGSPGQSPGDPTWLCLALADPTSCISIHDAWVGLSDWWGWPWWFPAIVRLWPCHCQAT